MKSYPSIPVSFEADAKYHVYDKLDGSNIRVDWTHKSGFTRFGTRRRVINLDDAFWSAAETVRNLFEKSLSDRLRQIGAKEATCFFEYFGPNSFAGDHPDPSDQRTALLIDAHIARKGLLSPADFQSAFQGIPQPRYFGELALDKPFINSVRVRALSGMTFEGVVCKRMKGRKVQMTKIKSNAWLERLRAECQTEAEFLKRM